MSDAATRPLAQAPSLDVLAQDPASAANLPMDVRSALLARAAAVLVVLAAATPAPPARVDPTGEQLLTLPEVAGLLKVPKSEAYALARRGVLPIVRVGPKYVRVRCVDLEEWLRTRREGGLVGRLSQGYIGSRGNDRRAAPAAAAATRPHPGRARRADGRALERRRPVGARRAADLGAGGAVCPAPGSDREEPQP